MIRWLSRRDFVVLAASAAAITVVTALLRLLPRINPTTVALMLLLVVLGASTFASLRVATIVSVVAVLAFNFFFVPPIHTFTVADTQNWIAVFVFLAVAIIASNLSAAAQQRAREAQRADLTATLLASLSHDVRTPLTAIKVAIENLSGTVPIHERQMQAAAAINEIDRLTKLFEDILDMARIDAAAIRVDRQWITPSDIIDAAGAYARRALDGHPLRVDADEQMEVELDPRLVSVALAHVLENGARYSPAAAPIDVRAWADGQGLNVAVTDFGPGLDRADLPHLFEPFYRGRTTRETTVGTGMGLSIARGLLAAVGGIVWAENVAGAGARFSIRVPGSVRTPVSGDPHDTTRPRAS